MLTAPVNGSLDCSDVANINSTCHYKCNRGFYLTGNDIAVCKDEDGNGIANWSNPPATCKRKNRIQNLLEKIMFGSSGRLRTVSEDKSTKTSFYSY